MSPIDSTAITGFSLILDGTGVFSRSSQVTGKVYAADYASPSPTTLTTAIGNMQTAYTDAAGRTLPDYTELGSGNIGGKTLAPGLYKWGTSVTIPTDVTLSGGPNDVWILQIAGNLTMAGAKTRYLERRRAGEKMYSGKLRASSVWTLERPRILRASYSPKQESTCKRAHPLTDASCHKTAVTLDANAVTSPTSQGNPAELWPAFARAQWHSHPGHHEYKRGLILRCNTLQTL